MDLLFEASVAGAIPLVRLLRESLAGEHIVRLTGIVNGTTNYMLTRMSEEGIGYAEALAEAQSLGYAEADPTADVEGYDAAAKAAILAGIAFDADVVAADVHREGIVGIEPRDIAFAHRLGYEVKLLAVAELVSTPRRCGYSRPAPAVAVRVHPAMVPKDHPLASVRGSFNAVFVEGDAAGELMVYGRGAGGRPTASAVLGDVIDAAHHLREGSRGRSARRRPPRSGRSRASQPVLPDPRRRRPPGRPCRRRLRLRRPPRLDPFHGADGPRRRSPPAVHHPHGPRGRRHGDVGRLGRPRLGRADRIAAARHRSGTSAGVTACQPALRQWRGVLEEYRQFLPVTEATPVVTLQEGGTPLLPARRLSERVGAEVWLKIEGLTRPARSRTGG